jgi:hypothetical protein
MRLTLKRAVKSSPAFSKVAIIISVVVVAIIATIATIFFIKSSSDETNNSLTIVSGASIQSVTTDQCQALPVYTGSNDDAIRTVTDSRGGIEVTYQIAKLADNNCWMLNNLRLGSATDTIALTSENTNIDSNFTLPKLLASASDPNNPDQPEVYGPVPGDTTGINDATNYGYLYNWSAATAGETRSSHPAGAGLFRYK